MRHQKIALELALEKVSSDREANLPTNLRRTRRSPQGKNYYRSTHRSESLQPTPQPQYQRQSQMLATGVRRRRRRRQVNSKRFIFLASGLILSLFILKLLVSFLNTSVPAFSQYFHNSQPAVTVLPSISPVDALSHAIISQESTENFESINPHSQALGLAQIMPANLSVWSEEALGYQLTADEFLNHPDLQRQIINYKLNEYWQDALVDSKGDEELAVLKVASHWYSGDPDLYTSKATQWYRGENGKLYRYPSITEYSNSVLKRYKKYMKWAREIIRNS